MKKHLIGVLIAMAVCLCLMTVPAAAAEIASGTCGGVGDGSNLTWVLTDDGTLTISGTGAMTNWNNQLDTPWNNVRYDIKTVVIEDGVTNVGSFAFTNFYITDVTVGDGVTAIGKNAFSSCYGLKTVTLGSSVATIGSSAFSGCEALTSMTVPDSVKTIGDYAFSGCMELASITIPHSVTTIGEEVFFCCAELTSVTVGSGLVSIGTNAFMECASLTEIVVDNSNSSYSSLDGVLFNKTKTQLIVYPSGKADAAYTIPNSVTAIDSCAFYDAKLTGVTIPKSVTSIGVSAFCYCSRLTSVTFEGGAPSIGDNAFYNVTATCYYPATDASWTYSVQQPYGGTLNWREYYPTSGTCGEGLSWQLSNDGTLTVFGTGAMTEWRYSTDTPWYGLRDDIKAVVIEDGVTSVGTGAFEYCYELADVTLGRGVTSIGEYAFKQCPVLTDITIPDSVTSIGMEAFSSCYDLEKVTIGSGVTTIGDGAFFDCPELTVIDIPGNVTTIGGGAFSYCSKLADVSIADGVTTVGASAFYGCSALTGITIPGSVTSVGEGAFRNCSLLTGIEVDGSSLSYVSVDGVLFNKDKTELLMYPVGKAGTSYTIPNSVTSIGSYAFHNCSKLTVVTIPSGVTSVGDYAFAGCSGLTGIAFPDRITAIGEYAFNNCSELTAVTIPAGIVTIGDSAFASCSKLTEVMFKGSAPTIGTNAFYRVTATCLYPASNPTWTGGKRANYGGTLTWSGTGTASYEPAVLNNGCYEISNASQLCWFADYVNGGHLSANGRLMADIVLNNGDVIGSGTYSENASYLHWTPIAVDATYSGIFDGNGHSISGLYYYCKTSAQAAERGSFGGLFYDVSGTVCDLTIENSFFYHYNYAAALCRSNTGTIKNCSVTAYVTNSGNYINHAGLVYQNKESGRIENCTYHGNRSASNGICGTNNGTIAGCSNYANHVKSGICGSNYGTVSGCVNYGLVSGHSNAVGGICSWNDGTVSDCTNTGEVNGIYMNTGGICGSNDGLILRCANTGYVHSTTTYTGGICGDNSGDKVGGGVVKSCYNTGEVSSLREYCGGIVGDNTGLVTGCYNTGLTYNRTGTGSICGNNNVMYLHDSTGEIKLYDMTGAVTNCISYRGSTIIGTSVSGSVSSNNRTEAALYGISPAYLMNGFTAAGDVDWYQNIDNGQTPDSYAVWDPTHGKVYRVGNSYTNTPQEEVKAGSCGDYLEWALDKNGTLTITGSGSMNDYVIGSAPWYPWRDEIRSVVLVGNISAVGSYAFYNCTALKHMDLGKYISIIRARAFAGCTGLETFYFPQTANESIGYLAFYGCTKLKALSLPIGVTVSNYAFEGCTALDSIYINCYDGGYSPAINVSKDAFAGVSATVYYPEEMDQPGFGSVHGGTLQFESTVTGTCGVDTQWAFDAANGTLTLSGTGWPQEYFEGRDAPWAGLRQSITNVVVTEGITGISNHLFEFLEKAETISLPEGLTTLYCAAFKDCTSLNNLLIPASVISMGDNVGFIDCNSLTDVYYLGTAEKWAQVEYSENCNVSLHCLILQNDNAPTCTESGTAPYYAFDDKTVYSDKYSENGEVITRLETLPATGHQNKKTVEGTDPTCSETGLTEGVYCSDCKTWLTPQETVGKLGHIDEDTDHVCDRACGKTDMGIHADADADHKCDYGCEEPLTACVDGEDADHKCDICGEDGISAHSFTEAVAAEKYLESAATCEEPAVYYMSCACGQVGVETFSFGSANDHSMDYRIIDGELYYACGNCDEREVARSVVWDGKTASVVLDDISQVSLICAALYDANDCMIEVRVIEVTGTETPVTFARTEEGARLKVFFVDTDWLPLLSDVSRQVG